MRHLLSYRSVLYFPPSADLCEIDTIDVHTYLISSPDAYLPPQHSQDLFSINLIE